MSSSRTSIIVDDNGPKLSPESFKVDLLQSIDKTLESMKLIWKEAGYEENECQSLLGELFNKLTTCLSSELTAEQRILDHAKEQIVVKLNHYNDLCAQLGRSGKIESDLGSNYANKFSTLDKLLEIIDIDISQRESLLNGEYSKIIEICTCLGEEIASLDSYEAPHGFPALSDARLELLREVHNKFQQMKKERIENMKKNASKSFEYIKDLEIVKEGWQTLPDHNGDDNNVYEECNNALMKYFQTGDWTMGYHIKDIKMLENRLKSLSEEKNRRKDELTSTGAEIARLWTLLRIPTTERDAFNASFKMNLSIETLSKGHQEYERLLNVRKTSLKRVITSIRNDITTLWNEAGIESEQQRRIELPIYFENVESLEDSAVEMHESYYTKLKARVDELRPILNKIARREAVIQERVELEHIQLNPERLIARGPKAREDRKREEEMSSRVKNLEKVTKELLNQIAAWEDQHGPFLFAGEKYIDRVNKQEENYIEIRDTLRNARKKKDVPTRPESFTAKSNTIRKPITTYQSVSFTAATSPRKGELVSSGELTAHDLTTLSNHDENNRPRNRNSHESDTTDYTSITEVRERASSATVVKSYIGI